MIYQPTAEETRWLKSQLASLSDELVTLSASAWAEEKRYLPASVSALPGYYRFDVAPYLREITDCFSVDSPVRHVSIMKGVQMCVTTMVENVIGYYIDHVKTATMMFLTADADLAKLRMESHITPMLQNSGLMHLITSLDERNTRKTGKTDKKIEWEGGGSLIPFGARNAAKLRSNPIPVLLRDEVDAYPLKVGNDGDPIKLSEDRTAAFETTRKILDNSTPLLDSTSRIRRLFEQGDQRHYFVCCLKCNFPQILRWKRTNPETGEVTGMTWETEEGRLVPGSSRYLCEACSHPHTNDDKARLLAPENGAVWKPTAVPSTPFHRSYHLPALYSPPGMQTFDACVAKFLQAWDPEREEMRSKAAYQVFQNNVLGVTFKEYGERVRLSAVSLHRRREYKYGEVPNNFTLQYCGSRVLVVVCTVDVQKDNLAVTVTGWCRDKRSVLLNYWRFNGPTDELQHPDTWGRLRDLILARGEFCAEEDEDGTRWGYVADDGCRYRIGLTLVDSGYRADDVYGFCSEFESFVFPIKGRSTATNAAKYAEFSEFTTPLGTVAYHISVDIYKDRWYPILRKEWDGFSAQSYGHFNAPWDATEAQLKELTVETKTEITDDDTQERKGVKWVRPQGAKNELWDTLVYSAAAIDLIAWDIQVVGSEEKGAVVMWPDFWDQLESQRLFFEAPD